MRLRTALVVVGISLAALPASASAAPPYPVSYNFLDATATQGNAQHVSPPGANDFSCRPSIAHPQPVVLVHGLLANQTVNWNTMSPLLANDGYCVFALTYGTKAGVEFPFYQPGGLKRMEESARQLSEFIDEVLAATGARKVDIVGHSEGSLMPNYYVKYLDGAAKVDDYVGLTTIWNGTEFFGTATLAILANQYGLGADAANLVAQFCDSCTQFLRGSNFMQKMRAGGVPHPAVDYTNIVTRYDELVQPYTSGLMEAGPNVTNHTLQEHCELDLTEHMGVAADPIAGILILNALNPPQHARPIPCQLVTAIGAPLATPPEPLDSDGDSRPDYSDPCPLVTGESCAAAPAAGGALSAKRNPRAAAKRRCAKRTRVRAKRRCLRRAKKLQRR